MFLLLFSESCLFYAPCRIIYGQETIIAERFTERLFSLVEMPMDMDVWGIIILVFALSVAIAMITLGATEFWGLM